MADITHILEAIDDGDPHAAEELLPLVYEELRRLAAQKMAQEAPGQTLQSTALVHEAYIRLVGSEGQGWDSRGHFFAAAAEAMRRILVEQARKRRRRAAIQGSQISLDALAQVTAFPNQHLLQLDQALEKLELRNSIAAAIVKLRFFAGLSMKQAAEALGLPLRTAERHWTYARTWLHRELEQAAAGECTD